MKKLLLKCWLGMTALLCVPSSAAAADKGFAAIRPDACGALSVRMEPFSEIFIVNYSFRGRSDEWHIYRQADTQDGTLHLEGVAAFTVDSRKNLAFARKPGDAVIAGFGSDKPSFEIPAKGVKLELKPGQTSGLHYDNKRAMLAYSDYLLDPEAYTPDSAAAFPAHKYALITDFDAKSAQQRKAAKEAKTEWEQRQSDTSRWFILALLLPFIASIVMYFRTKGNLISAGFKENSRAIATIQAVGFLMIVASICAMPFCSGGYIFLGALLVFAIELMNLAFGLRVIRHVKYARNGKFPWVSGIAFTLVTLMCGWAAVVIPVLMTTGARIDAEQSTGSILLGCLLGLSLMVVLGLWFRHDLLKQAPRLKGTVLPVCIILFFTGLAVATLLLVVIALAIFSRTARSASGSSGPASGSGNSAPACSNCLHQQWNLSCPYFDNPNATDCPKYTPKH